MELIKIIFSNLIPVTHRLFVWLLLNIIFITLNAKQNVSPPSGNISVRQKKDPEGSCFVWYSVSLVRRTEYDLK